MKPIVDELEQKYKGQIVVKRINADVGDGPTIMRAYRIQGHPTILIFDREGHEVQRFLGPHPAESVEVALDVTIVVEP